MPIAFQTLSVRQLRSLCSLAILVSSFLSFGGCKKESSRTQEIASSEKVPPGSLELVFPYGSEKEKWINDVTREFNQSKVKTPGGKTIYVRALPMGSGETIDNILSGRLQAHIASPASAAFIKLS
jgi:Ca-activated chloride channel family protein